MTWRSNQTRALTAPPSERHGYGAGQKLTIWCLWATLAKSAKIRFFAGKLGLPARPKLATAASWRGKWDRRDTWKSATARLLLPRVECIWMFHPAQSGQDIRLWKTSSG